MVSRPRLALALSLVSPDQSQINLLALSLFPFSFGPFTL